MKKTLILIAGPPATGKTYLVNLITEIQPKLYQNYYLMNLKEDIADSKGFNNLVEKASLENIVWKAYYQAIDAYMMVGKKVNFE